MNASQDRPWLQTRLRRMLAAPLLVASLGGAPASPAQAASGWTPVALTDSLGSEIDSLERRTYHLFPDVEGFQSARTLTDGSSYRVMISEQRNGTVVERRSRLSAEGWEASRLHARLVERYRDSSAPTDWDDNELEYRLALRFAAESRHDMSRVLLVDLAARPGGDLVVGAEETRQTVDRILGARRALYLAGPVTDRSGRTDLLIFAGLYGVWAGVAAPIAFEAEDAKVYAAGLLAVPTLSMLIASSASRNADMGVGRAHVISTGGWLGTWQGIGWAALNDAEGEAIVRSGLLSGLAGIATASLLTGQVHFTEGQGVLTGHALPWGAWFGLVAGTVAGTEGDGLLRTTLLASDAFVLGTAIAARDAHMSKGRVRLISLMGVVGTVAGFGVDVLVEVDDTETAMAIAGMGSVAGLAIGAAVTRNHDDGKDLSDAAPEREERWSMEPHGRVVRDPDSGRTVPALGVRVSF